MNSAICLQENPRFISSLFLFGFLGFPPLLSTWTVTKPKGVLVGETDKSQMLMAFTATDLITQKPLGPARRFITCVISKTVGKSGGFLGNTQVQRFRSLQGFSATFL